MPPGLHPSGPIDAPPGGRPGGNGGRRRGLSRTAIIGILAVVVLLLSGTLAGLALTRSSATTTSVALEPVSSAGTNPFMPPVGTDQARLTAPAGSGGSFSGSTQGLYGGTMRQGSCNPRQMVDFLNANPDKSAAWASVLGVQPTDIARYVATLTPVLLRSDVAVTNHGFTGGHATSFPAVLEAGTAVLVDRFGTPVTKCFCGNPLTRPSAYSGVTYTGTRWQSFNTGGITTVVVASGPVDLFILVDPVTGASFNRPSGTGGDADVHSGDVQATLIWSSDHDMDLHVTDPAGEEIYFSHKNSASGGQLDHDDIPGCGSAPETHVENIFWPSGGAPAGGYEAHVVLYSQCGGAVADYQLRVTVGGRIIYNSPGELTTEKDESTPFTFSTSSTPGMPPTSAPGGFGPPIVTPTPSPSSPVPSSAGPTVWGTFPLVTTDPNAITANIHTGPHVGDTVVGRVTPTGTVAVVCSVPGDNVDTSHWGSSSNWDYIVSPTTGYVADALIDTHGDVAPRCPPR